MPDSVEPKLRQAEYCGSPEWVRSYARRIRVEGSFGLVKTGFVLVLPSLP